MKKTAAILFILMMTLTISGCGETAAQTETTQTTQVANEGLDLLALYTEMAENLPEMIEMDAATLQDYCGVEPESYAQAVAAVNYNGLETDEIWLIEAVDEAAADSIQQMAELRLEMKGEETITYAPDQYEVVQKAKLIREGVYVALIVTPEAETLAQQFQEALDGK